MKTIRTFIRRYSVQTYYALTIIISWGCMLVVMGPGGVLGTEPVAVELMPLVYLATLVGPSIAGLVLTGLADGREGFRELRSRLFRWRNGIRWYAVALLTAPILITATLSVLSLASPAFLPAIVTVNNKGSLLLTGIIMGLVVGFFEELGWTGFAVPRLREDYGVLKAGLILGLMWGLWHLPLFLNGVRSSGPILGFLYLMVLLFSFLPAYRVLMVWIHDRTGSLLNTMLMHAPLAAGQLILVPTAISRPQFVIYDLLFTALLWGFVAIVAVANQWQFAESIISERQT